MVWRQGVMGLGLLALLAGCQGTEMAGEQEVEAADDADDGPTAEDDSGQIVRGGTGDVGGELPDVAEFRNPRFGRGGSLR